MGFFFYYFFLIILNNELVFTLSKADRVTHITYKALYSILLETNPVQQLAGNN